MERNELFKTQLNKAEEYLLAVDRDLSDEIINALEKQGLDLMRGDTFGPLIPIEIADNSRTFQQLIKWSRMLQAENEK